MIPNNIICYISVWNVQLMYEDQERIQPQAQFGSRVAFAFPSLVSLSIASSSRSSSSLIMLLVQHDTRSLMVSNYVLTDILYIY